MHVLWRTFGFHWFALISLRLCHEFQFEGPPVEISYQASLSITTTDRRLGVLRKLQASADIEILIRQTLEDAIQPSLDSTTQRLLSVTIDSITVTGGQYDVDYTVVLEELLCDSSGLNCDWDAASSTMYDDTTAFVSNEISNGGFAATLQANAATCGASCVKFQSGVSIQEGTIGAAIVVIVTESPSSQPSSSPSSQPSENPSVSIWPTTQVGIVALESAVPFCTPLTYLRLHSHIRITRLPLAFVSTECTAV